jgi:hypothetical protein
MELPRPAAQKPQDLVLTEIIGKVFGGKVIDNLGGMEGVVEQKGEVKGGGSETARREAGTIKAISVIPDLTASASCPASPNVPPGKIFTVALPPVSCSTFRAKGRKDFWCWMCITGMKWASFKSMVSARPGVAAAVHHNTTTINRQLLPFMNTTFLLPVDVAATTRRRDSSERPSGPYPSGTGPVPSHTAGEFLIYLKYYP